MLCNPRIVASGIDDGFSINPPTSRYPVDYLRYYRHSDGVPVLAQ